MASSFQLEVKLKAKIVLRPENEFSRRFYKNDHFAVFIRHDSTEIWYHKPTEKNMLVQSPRLESCTNLARALLRVTKRRCGGTTKPQRKEILMRSVTLAALTEQ